MFVVLGSSLLFPCMLFVNEVHFKYVRTANLRTKIQDFGGFDSSGILVTIWGVEFPGV